MTLSMQEAWLRTGYVVWHLQVLEDALATHYVMLHDLEPQCSRETFELALERRRGQTLGTLLKLQGFAATLPTPLRARLNTLLAERNWLLHRSRRDVHVELNAEALVPRILARIDAIGDEAVALVKDIQDATESGLVAKGISIERITNDAADILRAWDTGRRHAGEIGLT